MEEHIEFREELHVLVLFRVLHLVIFWSVLQNVQQVRFVRVGLRVQFGHHLANGLVGQLPSQGTQFSKDS